MTDQNLPTPEPVAEAPASWSQPPAAGAGWAQPPSGGGVGRPVFGSTEAKLWQPNPELAARHEQVNKALAAEAASVAAQAPAPVSYAPVRTFTPTVQACPRCGGTIDWDGYCEQCGAKAPTVREHFEQTPADWVAGVCDRGVRHARNEDAMALDASAQADGRAALVVCDGVSMSTDSDQASMAAAKAALSFLLSRPDWDWNLLDLAPEGQTAKVLEQTAVSANDAVLANSDLSEPSPASCTLAIGLVNGQQLLAATLGDSRVYWLPDQGVPTILSRDHSMAQEEIEMGVEREVAETGSHSHVITRWLGRDAPDLTPELASTRAEGPGWLLVCSDGLWNYSSDPEAMARLVQHYAEHTGQVPLELAKALVQWANDQGGHDNITAAVARLAPTTLEPPTQHRTEPEPSELPTTRTRPVAAAEPNPTS